MRFCAVEQLPDGQSLCLIGQHDRDHAGHHFPRREDQNLRKIPIAVKYAAGTVIWVGRRYPQQRFCTELPIGKHNLFQRFQTGIVVSDRPIMMNCSFLQQKVFFICVLFEQKVRTPYAELTNLLFQLIVLHEREQIGRRFYIVDRGIAPLQCFGILLEDGVKQRLHSIVRENIAFGYAYLFYTACIDDSCIETLCPTNALVQGIFRVLLLCKQDGQRVCADFQSEAE